MELRRLTARLFVDNLSKVRCFSGLGFENLAFGTDRTVYGALESPRIAGAEVEVRL